MGAGKANHNLPSPLTSFVGRDRHLDRIVQLLDGQRLVTLVGPGGGTVVGWIP